MSTKKIICLLACMVTGLPFAWASKIETRIGVEANSEYNMTRKHPAILGKCWGHKDDRLNLSSSSSIDVKKSYAGERDLNFSNNGISYTPGSVSWNSAFHGGRKFQLNFKQNIDDTKRVEDNRSSTTCSRTYHSTKLSSVKTRVSSRGSIFVPENVYLLEVGSIVKNL